MWDENAINMAVNVIAKVEGSGAWDAINYSDPITVGLMQWFGTRASSILKDMKDNGVWSTDARLSNLSSDLESQAVTSRWWTSRYLTGSEGSALKPVLRANKDIQGATVASDIDDYKRVAINIGMNPDTNTKAVQFFCCMYHQTPARAIRIIKNSGAGSSLSRVYSYCMNDPVFKQYKTRYTTAKNIIDSGVPPEIIDLNDDDRPIPDDDGGNIDLGDDESHGQTPPTGNNGEQLQSVVNYLSIVGDQVHVKLRDGQTAIAVKSYGDTYILSSSATSDAPPIPNDPDDTGIPDPEPTPPDEPSSEKQATVKNWALSVLGDFGYTNDSRRVDIEASGWGDCSAFVRACYRKVGVKLGLMTSNQYSQGRRVTSSLSFSESQLEVGDLIYIQWKNSGWNSGKVTDHVEMYIGNDTLVGHPGSGFGPRTTALSTYRTLFRKVWIQRHI